MKKKYCGINATLTPDFMFNTFDEVTVDFLLEQGISALLIDIDNTLAPYEQPEPDEKIKAWFLALEQNGIKSALISNNHADRVELFNRDLGLPAFPDSGKPFGKTILIAMEQMGADTEHTAGLGDQLLTDTWAVHRLGMRSIIVPPIKDKTNLFFKSKRLLEKPFIHRYKKLHPGEKSNEAY